MTEEEAQQFLIDLQVISDRHGIIVNGCGCCGSPWLAREAERSGVYTLSTKFLEDEQVRYPSFVYTKPQVVVCPVHGEVQLSSYQRDLQRCPLCAFVQSMG